MHGNCSYGSEDEFIGKGEPMASRHESSGWNGHGITAIIALLQVAATLAGGGLFIRSIEQNFDRRMSLLESKIDNHMVASRRSEASMTFHHTIGVQCTKGCHINRSAEFIYEK